MQNTQENLLDNTNEFRRVRKLKNPSLSYDTPQNSTQCRNSSHGAYSPFMNHQSNHDNKENQWNANNSTYERPFRSPLQEARQFILATAKEVQSVMKPLEPEDEMGEELGKTKDSTGGLRLGEIKSYSGAKDNLVFKIKDDLGDGISLADTGETVEVNQGDQMEILMEQKRKAEEEAKNAKLLIIKTRKENNQHLKQLQSEFEREKEEMRKEYEESMNEIKLKYEQELKEKDEEIEVLSALIEKTEEPRTSRGQQDDNQRPIEEYEEIIEAMKEEFEETINKMTSFHQKKIKQGQEEKERMELEIIDLKAQIELLQQQSQPLPSTRRELNDTSKLDWETTGRIPVTNRLPPPPRHKKLEQVKDIHNLLEKINKYMDANSIENEVSITNRRELYKDICQPKNEIKVPAIKLGGGDPKLFKEATQNQEASKEIREDTDTLDSDYFKSIIEECQRNEGTVDVESEEEDIPKMNYSIKNLHNQLRFKPKCEEES